MLVILNKVTNEGTEVPLAVKKDCVFSVAPKDSTTNWVQYWDGKELRSAVIANTIEDVVELCRK